MTESEKDSIRLLNEHLGEASRRIERLEMALHDLLLFIAKDPVIAGTLIYKSKSIFDFEQTILKRGMEKGDD